MPKSNHSMKLPTTVPPMAVRTRFLSTTMTSSTSSRGASDAEGDFSFILLALPDPRFVSSPRRARGGRANKVVTGVKPPAMSDVRRTVSGMTELSAPTGREPALVAQPRSDGTAPRALVLGATGYLGGRLVPRLLSAGYRVRVLARDPRRVEAFPWGDEVETAAGDATDAEAVRAAVEGVDVLYYLIHSMGSARDFEATDRVAAQTVADAASAASVSRIVYLGGLHPDDATLSAHLRSRVEVGQILLHSGVADPRAAGGRRHRVGLGVLRDGAPPHRRAAVHARAQVGAQPHPADRRA